MPTVAPTYVANNFLLRAKRENIPITQFKMQKLVYLLYATYLRATNQPLFNERWEAWSRGPSIPSVYSCFGSFGQTPITDFALDARGTAFCWSERDMAQTCLNVVWEKYCHLTDADLFNIVCREGSAWYMARHTNKIFLEDTEIIRDGENINS